MLKKYTLNRLLILTTTVGFVFLLADTTIEHWAMFNQELMVFIPLVFTFAGILIGTLTVILWNDKVIRWMQIFLFVSFIIAGAGFYFHIEPYEDEVNLTAEEREHEENEKEKSLMAPLAFGGLAVVGLLGTMRRWEAEVVDRK